MNKKEILDNSAELKIDIGDINHKLVLGLEKLANSSGGSPLLTAKEYLILSERVKNKKSQQSFAGIIDINGRIDGNLVGIREQLANTSLLVSSLLHESESSCREYKIKNNELKSQLENYQIEIGYLERELARYKS